MTNELDLLQTLKVAFIAEIPLFSAETALFGTVLSIKKIKRKCKVLCQINFIGIIFVQEVFEIILIANC